MSVDEACRLGSDSEICTAAYERFKAYHKNHGQFDQLCVPFLMMLFLCVLLFIFQAGASWLWHRVLYPRHKVEKEPIIFGVLSLAVMGGVLIPYYVFGLFVMGMMEGIEGENGHWYLGLFYLVAKPFEALVVLEVVGGVLFSALFGVFCACGCGPGGSLMPLDRDEEANVESGSTEPKNEDTPAAAHDEFVSSYELANYDSTHVGCGSEEQHCAEADSAAVECAMDDCGCD